MGNTTSERGPLLAEIRDGFRGTRAIRRSRTAARRGEARAARTARAALEHDLAAYTSPRDLDDLDAMLGRYSEAETEDIRRVLAARRAA